MINYGETLWDMLQELKRIADALERAYPVEAEQTRYVPDSSIEKLTQRKPTHG